MIRCPTVNNLVVVIEFGQTWVCYRIRFGTRIVVVIVKK